MTLFLLNNQYVQQRYYIKNQDGTAKNKQISRLEYKIKNTSQHIWKINM